jgi:pyruvate/2-oxoglutarate dehydrogenase complex dihydrolipoamide dehydrogenase (E3) component
MLLVAAGRAPTVDGLDLEKAGIRYSSKGIVVDDRLRTSAHHIYAAGDCTGGYQFTHYAGWQAFQAARNALLPGHARGFPAIVPWTTFTDPEVAHAGLTEQDARRKFGNDVRVAFLGVDQVDRAITDNDSDGFYKLVFRKNETLLGVTIVAERAGESITEYVNVLRQGGKIGDLAAGLHVYPTYSTPTQLMAAEQSLDAFFRSPAGKVIGHFVR